MNYKDNIEWLKSLKQQIGKTQHCDLWHFEQVIDETIENLKPLAKPHGRLIDADNVSSDAMCSHCVEEYCRNNCECFIENVQTILSNELITPTIIEAEVSE